LDGAVARIEAVQAEAGSWAIAVSSASVIFQPTEYRNAPAGGVQLFQVFQQVMGGSGLCRSNIVFCSLTCMFRRLGSTG
jgi:hypothetical protein